MVALASAGLLAGGIGVAVASGAAPAPTSPASTAPGLAHVAPNHVPRVGIVNPMGMEQAPILAAMKVTGSEVIDGYRFWLGTLGGRPVVDVRSGEKEYAATLATTIMDLHFHVVANLMSGTSGAKNPAVNVGDVVVSGFVVDKSNIHFHSRGFNSPYSGVEMEVTGASKTTGSVIGGYGTVGPTPSTAATYTYGPTAATPHYVYYEALAASRSLVSDAEGDAGLLGTTPRSTAIGATVPGTITAKLDVGVIGSANQWTEPLKGQQSQNALYQTDAGENEGMGFAYANAKLGVPWLVVRGVSDSPWYPTAYTGPLASDRAAQVVSYVVANLPAHIGTAGATMTTLSPTMNAVQAGYIVAQQAWLSPTGTVTKVQYVNATGTTVTEAWPFSAEYMPSAGTAG